LFEEKKEKENDMSMQATITELRNWDELGNCKNLSKKNSLIIAFGILRGI
jgi:hypothetical protein